MSEQTPQGPSAAPVDLARLTAEAANKSGLLWVRIPESGESFPVWHVWHDPGADGDGGPVLYAVSGPGEQFLPWLPAEVELVLRSKDTGGRLLTRRATARQLDPASEEWTTAADLLRPERLNAGADVVERWRETCTLHALAPHGDAIESPGHYDDGSGSARVRPAPAATARWRPWHWRGRAGARRNTRG